MSGMPREECASCLNDLKTAALWYLEASSRWRDVCARLGIDPTMWAESLRDALRRGRVTIEDGYFEGPGGRVRISEFLRARDDYYESRRSFRRLLQDCMRACEGVRYDELTVG